MIISTLIKFFKKNGRVYINILDKLSKLIMIDLIKVYQYLLSPIKFYLFGTYCCCRFRTTCSAYAIKMYQSYNFFKASLLTIKRILRCNPFSKVIDE